MKNELKSRIKVLAELVRLETDSDKLLQHLLELDGLVEEYRGIITRSNPPPSEFEFEAARMYEPTDGDIRWARRNLDMISEGGVLVFPATGLIYKIDHHQKAVILQNPERLSDFKSFTMHLQTIATFKIVGYRVTENYPKDQRAN